MFKVVAVGVALPWKGGGHSGKSCGSLQNFSLAFVKIPLIVEDPSMSSWCKDLIGNLMESNTRKICYDAQSFVRSLLQTGYFDKRKGDLIFCTLTNKCFLKTFISLLGGEFGEGRWSLENVF